MQRCAIIVAGGSGSRMKSALPKQFLPLEGKPVLAHTLDRFHAESIPVILVLPENYLGYWEELSAEQGMAPVYRMVAGSDSRAGSVRNGLEAASSFDLVAVHDAVRPMVSSDLIFRLFESASHHGSAVPVLPLSDSLRVLQPGGSRAVDREHYCLVQTPQVFRFEWLKKAFENTDYREYTDEASLCEAAGFPLHLINGEPNNRKITLPSDLWLAENWLRQEIRQNLP